MNKPHLTHRQYGILAIVDMLGRGAAEDSLICMDYASDYAQARSQVSRAINARRAILSNKASK